MWTVRADPFSGSCCPALIPAVGAVGGGKCPLWGACAPRGPRKPLSWISPCSLRLLLLIGIYLHKKDLCQDHHSSLVHMAQSRVCPEDGVVSDRWEEGKELWSPVWPRAAPRAPHPSQCSVWCQDLPLLCPGSSWRSTMRLHRSFRALLLPAAAETWPCWSISSPPNQHRSLFEVPSNVLAGGDVILAGQCGSGLESLNAGLGDRRPSLPSRSSLGWDCWQKNSMLNLWQQGLSGDRGWLV